VLAEHVRTKATLGNKVRSWGKPQEQVFKRGS